MACMLLNSFNARLQRFIGSKSKVATAAAAATNEKRNSHSLQISAPFNFKRESISLPGLSEDDIAILKEKAAASRLGDEAGTVNDSPSAFTKPRKAPPAPPSPVRTVVPAILVTPNTPLSPKHNAI